LKLAGFGKIQPLFGIGGEQPFVEEGKEPEQGLFHDRKGIKLEISKKATVQVAFSIELPCLSH